MPDAGKDRENTITAFNLGGGEVRMVVNNILKDRIISKDTEQSNEIS